MRENAATHILLFSENSVLDLSRALYQDLPEAMSPRNINEPTGEKGGQTVKLDLDSWGMHDLL